MNFQPECDDTTANWRNFEVGQMIDALDGSEKWSEGKIVNCDENSVRIHFLYWSEKWDETLPRVSHRLAPYGTRACISLPCHLILEKKKF